MTQMETDIIVAGAGPVGLIAALSFAKAGFSVMLAGPAMGDRDRRTTALMVPALQFLDRIGVGNDIRAEAAPLEAMRIVDGTQRLIRSALVTFRAHEIGEPYFGVNIANRDLTAALEAAVSQTENVEWRQTLVSEWRTGPDLVEASLEGGDTIRGKLAVAADGRLSAAREAAGIQVSTRTLPQSALVLTFQHSRPHGSISTEFHTESGPFTQVPLKGLRSSLVWVVSPSEAEELLVMEDGALGLKVEEKMQSMLGRVTLEPGRQVYPLTASTPRRFARDRVALVGEAAHIFPPIGAQGLNLGVRDVADLVEIATIHADDPGSARALSAYDARRRPDILARSAAVNLLNRSLLSGMLPAQLARSAGLSALRSFAPLRAIFMREGLRPGSGLSGLIGDLRERTSRTSRRF